MLGPDIFARTLSKTRIPDAYGNVWQYHSRSDQHSKVACWGILVDMLENCNLLRQHAERDVVGFGINHEMRDYRVNRKKRLDLVICTPTKERAAKPRTLAVLADRYGIQLTKAEHDRLAALPPIHERPVSSVLVALEAKACMTEHIKACPRLFDELASSFQTILGDTQNAIAGAFVTINLADSFVSTLRNKRALCGERPEINRHAQPEAAAHTYRKVLQLPRRSRIEDAGFDAVGIVAIACRNDGSRIEVVTLPPSGMPLDLNFGYDKMIERMAHLYNTRFASR